MKKTILASLLAMASSAVFAQTNINKGDWMIGGDASFTSSKLSDLGGSTTSVKLTPNAGYFVSNNLAIGLGIGLQNEKASGEDGVTVLAAAPFVRYYFLPSTQKVNLFAQAGGGFGSASSGGESKSINVYSINAGPAIFIAPNVAVEIGVGYTSTGGDLYTFMGKEYRMNSFGMSVGFQIHLAGKK